MGRWAQAKRRGGGGAGSVVLGPPPVPTLHQQGDDLLIQSQDTDDSGGRLQLWYSDSETGPFSLGEDAGWQAEELVIADKGGYVGFWIAGLEVGNGTIYTGASALSAATLVV